MQSFERDLKPTIMRDLGIRNISPWVLHCVFQLMRANISPSLMADILQVFPKIVERYYKRLAMSRETSHPGQYRPLLVRNAQAVLKFIYNELAEKALLPPKEIVSLTDFSPMLNQMTANRSLEFVMEALLDVELLLDMLGSYGHCFHFC